MEFETYADVIDSYEISDDKLRGISLTDYIKNNNIRIKEIDMDPMGDFEKIIKGSKPMEKEGIESLQLASGDMDIRIEEVVKEFIRKNGRKPRSLEEIKEFYFKEMTNRGGAGSNKDNVMLAKYDPGDYTQDEIDAYENYKYNMNEQMPGFPIMEIDQFLRMEEGEGRAGVAAGGLPGILGV
tara:strand:- start:663 stop:1208 length:546 start_codon:yes stop_codon:yes gene_type:complete